MKFLLYFLLKIGNKGLGVMIISVYVTPISFNTVIPMSVSKFKTLGHRSWKQNMAP